MRTFRLYPEERHWWSFNDYGAVLDVMERIKPARVLEFGPGSSTLALIEGGATHIDTCEDDPAWFETYRERLQAVYPEIVTVVPYVWADPLTVPGLGRKRYDLALVDGPFGTPQRPAAIEYALKRATAVLVPTEDCGRTSTSLLRPIIHALAGKYGKTTRFYETGPLSGGFALLEPIVKAA